MPAYIVRTSPSTKDGSSLGGLGMVMVQAANAAEAKADGAAQLGVSELAVVVEPYENNYR